MTSRPGPSPSDVSEVQHSPGLPSAVSIELQNLQSAMSAQALPRHLWYPLVIPKAIGCCDFSR